MKLNRNNRFVRAMIAAKRAFFTGYVPAPPKAQSAQKSPAAPKNGNPPAKNPAAPAVAPEKPAYLINENPKTINDLAKGYCTGCTACYNACPVDAIKMEFNEWGYINAMLDTDKCISCGKCAKVCPVLNTKKENTANPDTYALMADDEIRRQSSSGGAFTLAAEYILDNGGYVCGAALMDDFTVAHIIISDKEQLGRLRGSKYTQSKLEKTFSEIKKLLDDNKTVLFSGCPCQVAGLSGFLGKKYDNLYTLDLVCHGAPPQKAFVKYLDETYGRENLKDFKFRTKEYGYNSFNQIAYMKDGRELGRNIKFDFYEKCMHTGLALMDVCGDCMFAPAPRQGDMSIGDNWGISKYNPALNDNIGTSVVLANNDKGRRLLEAIKPSAKLLKSVPYDHVRVNNRFGQKMKIPAGRRWFYTMFPWQPFDKAVEYSLNRRFDVGVIGLWYGRNYGSVSTYYALHQVLTKYLHLSVLMIENPLKPAVDNFTRTHPKHFSSRFYDVSVKRNIEDLGQLNAFCDTFMVGSDQLWNVYLSRPYKQMYYLDFASEYKKRIAYGTSFGIEYKGSKEEMSISGANLKKFDHVSVRDDMSERIATEMFGVENVTQVCDPTLLCPVEEYYPLCDLAEIRQEGEYMLAYILDPNEEIGRQLEMLAEKSGCKIVVLLDEHPKLFEKNFKALNILNNDNIIIKKEITVYEWMWHYRNAKAVVTDSFHGTIFSIIFQKPFISLINVRRGRNRFISLLTPLKLMYRLFEQPQEIEQHYDLLDGIDYTEPNAELAKIRDYSMNWLKNAIFSPKKFTGKTVFNYEEQRTDNPRQEIQ